MILLITGYDGRDYKIFEGNRSKKNSIIWDHDRKQHKDDYFTVKSSFVYLNKILVINHMDIHIFDNT